jgi:hypothetical protein
MYKFQLKKIQIDGCIPLFEVSAFGVKVLKMTCTTLPEGILASSLEKISNEATKKTVDASSSRC